MMFTSLLPLSAFTLLLAGAASAAQEGPAASETPAVDEAATLTDAEAAAAILDATEDAADDAAQASTEEAADAVSEVAADVAVLLPAAYRVEVREEFRATGDEPAYWASFSRNDFRRTPREDGRVDFSFDLREIEAVIGSAEPVRCVIESGAGQLTVTQDPTTQLMAMEGEATVVEFLNGQVEGLEPRAGTWTQTITPFDGTVVPGATAAELELRCEARDLVLDDLLYSLIEFSSQEVTYAVGAAEAQMTFSGIAILAPDRSVVHHMVFQQRGKVTNGDLVSDIFQLSTITMLDASNMPTAPLDRATMDRVDRFLFLSRPDTAGLDPSVFQADVRPAWSTPVWLAGRVSEASLGLTAEQGTNPIPVTALGGLVLTDESLGYAGNILYDELLIERGERNPDLRNPADKEYRSPLERTYGGAAAAATRVDERLTLLGPDVAGAARVGDGEPFLIGAGAIALFSTLQSGSPSNLGFATAGKSLGASTVTSSGSLAAGGLAGGSAAGAAAAGASTLSSIIAAGGGLALVGAGAVVAVAEVADELDDDDDDNAVGASDPNAPVAVISGEEITAAGGCNAFRITLTVSNDNAAGVVQWALGSSLTTDGCAGTAAGTVMDMQTGNVTGGGVVISIDTPDFSTCIEGTITVDRNGAPARFSIFGVIGADGSYTFSCLQ